MDNFFNNNTLNGLLILGIIFLVIYLIRDILTWYWKQNEIIKQLQINNKLLNDIYPLIKEIKIYQQK